MNLVVQKIKEINEAIREFDKGKGSMSTEQVQAFVQLINASHRWASLAVQAWAIDSKNKRALKGLSKMNIMDEDEALDLLGYPEENTIKCTEQDKIITRAECLDYSGSHIDDCRGCETGKATKAKLLPPKE